MVEEDVCGARQSSRKNGFCTEKIAFAFLRANFLKIRLFVENNLFLDTLIFVPFTSQISKSFNWDYLPNSQTKGSQERGARSQY